MHIHLGHIFFGSGNFGDDLVVAGFLEGVKQVPGLRLTCVSAFDTTSQRLRFPQIEWYPNLQEHHDRLIQECDLWLGLGASVLQPENDHWLLPGHTASLAACRNLNKPVFFLGSGIDYRRDAQRPEIRLLLDTARAIWTREALSAQALQAMGYRHGRTGADLSHLYLGQLPAPAIEAGRTGFVCNFELSRQYTIEALAALIDSSAAPNQPVQWLVQEVRALDGSELDLLARLPDATRQRLELRVPDYAQADLATILASWGTPEQIFTTRFHGAIIGAWRGSRVVAFERQQKLRGIAQALGIPSFTALPDPAALARAFAEARPVPRAVLESQAALARQSCTEFLQAVGAAAAPAITVRESKPMSTRVEHHTLTGVTEVGLDRIAPGIKRGEIFVVRNCLQAIGGLDPLRAMILDVLEEVAGPAARGKAVSAGLNRLHDFVPVEQLMQMNPLMKQRARRLAAPIIAAMAEKLGFGPNVHFEDTPNVRIFVPHDVMAQHDAAFKDYAKRRGSGGELTLHPPHQDSRHYHPTGAINIWCAIADVVEANGMTVYPEFYGHHLPCTKADGGLAPGQYLGPPISMDLAPGDAWIFETVHLHASTLNQTDDTRFVISFRVTTDTPHYPDKPWYNYVRPADCTPDGPPPSQVDYSKGQPSRGPVTLDTSNRFPPAVVAVAQPDGTIAVPSGMVPEGEIRPISEDLCIARIGGKPVAFQRGCPHEGADLAGGVIRHGQIMCPWHGLRINPADGTSGCKTLQALELMVCAEQGGTILIGAAAMAEPVPPPVDEHHAAVTHFIAAADQFVTLLGDYRAVPSPSKLDQLTSARDTAVYALLGLPGSVVRTRLAAPATRLLGAIHESETRYRARSPEQDATFAECRRRLGQGWGDDAGYVYGLAALALCWHGYELVALQPLRQELGWAEPIWLHYLLTSPPAFREPGQAETFAATIEPLMEQIEERLERATPETRPGLVSAFVSADIMVPAYFNELNMRPAMLARARAVEKLMQLEGARLDQLVVRSPGRRRPRIGFIAIAVQDRTESVFLLAHMEHLGRQGFDVRLYCRKDPEGRIGILCRNAAAHYARLPESILASTAYLRAEDLDIAVFASNLTAPVNAPVMYAAQRIARIQVTGTWSPLTSGLRQIDAMLSGEYGEPAGAEAQYSEELIRLPGGHACFPFERMLEGERAATTPSRAELGIPEEATVFVSAAFGGKILPELSRAWTRIISEVPDSYLVLLPFNPNWSRRFDSQALLRRLAAEWEMAGLTPDRLRILSPVPTVADLHLVLGQCDIYLDSFPYTGACSIFDPVAVGLPIVARAGETCRSRQSYTMLREIGLEDSVATTEHAYIARAVRLGTDPEFLAEEATRLVLNTAERPPFVDTERYAAKLAPALTGLLDAWDARSDALHTMPATARLDRIAQLAGRLGRTRADFTGRDVLEEIVLPYLRHGGRRHFVYVGRDFDTRGKALLEEGWMGILFGPDGKPAQQPGAAFGLGADIGIAAHIDQSMFNDANLIAIDAEGNDYAILTGLNFGVMSPGLLTATYDPRRPGQDSAATERVLVGMLKNGYRSAYFGLNFDPATGLTQLVDIGVDSVPPTSFTAILVFFRTADETFLPSLLGWLEDATGLTAETRLRATKAPARKAAAE